MTNKTTATQKKSRFASMRDEVLKDYKEPDPYVIDEVIDPPIVIHIPSTYQGLMDMAAIQDEAGGGEGPDRVPMAVLEHLCAEGDFTRLQEAIKTWPPKLVKGTFDDLFAYFSEVHNWDDDAAVEEIPGKG